MSVYQGEIGGKDVGFIVVAPLNHKQPLTMCAAALETLDRASVHLKHGDTNEASRVMHTIVLNTDETPKMLPYAIKDNGCVFQCHNYQNNDMYNS